MDYTEPAYIVLLKMCIAEYGVRCASQLPATAFRAWLRSRRALYPHVEALARRAEEEGEAAFLADHWAEYVPRPGGGLRILWHKRQRPDIRGEQSR
jgi:hypothetical protein